jgi:4-amino-4-deoxy-L-arabinose transferase-like glycosyltransferase
MLKMINMKFKQQLKRLADIPFKEYLLFFSKNLIPYFPMLYTLLILFFGFTLYNGGSYQIDSENDFFNSYIPHAEKLLNGNLVVDDYRGPLYIIILALFKLIFNDYLHSAVFISAVSSGFFLFFIFKIIENLFSVKEAIIVLLASSFNLYLAKFSYAPGTDMLTAALAAAGLYFFFNKTDEGKIFPLIYSASFLSLAFLTRYNSAILILMVIPIILFSRKFFREKLKRITAAGVFVAASVILITPWGIYTKQKTGEFLYNKNYMNVALALESNIQFDWETAWIKAKAKYSSAADLIVKDFDSLIAASIKNLFIHAGKDFYYLLGWHWGIFLFIGLFTLKKIKDQKQRYFLMIFLFNFLMLTLVFYSTRFSFFLIPAYIIAALRGIEFAEEKFPVLLKAKFKLVHLLLLLSLLQSIWYNAYVITGGKELQTVITEIKNNDINIEGKKLAAMRPHIAYHLGLKWFKLPYHNSYDDIINKLKEEKIDYLFIGSNEIEKRKDLSSFIKTDGSYPDLKLILKLPDQKIFLYKFIY